MNDELFNVPVIALFFSVTFEELLCFRIQISSFHIRRILAPITLIWLLHLPLASGNRENQNSSQILALFSRENFGEFSGLAVISFWFCFFVAISMGACCSRDGSFRGVRDREIDVVEYEDDNRHHENDVRRGDYGASVRLKGSSTLVAMATQQGRKGINQDAMTVWEGFIGEKDVFFCGVFDGHGPCGHKVARHVRDNLPSKLSSTYKLFHTRVRSQNDGEDDGGGGGGSGGGGEHGGGHDHQEPNSPIGHNYDNSVFGSWKASFVRSFREMDKDLSLDGSIECYCSGSTAVTVVKQGDHLMIGNLGDSRAVLCTRGDKGQVIPIQLTVDMKPSLPREAERISSCRGRVFALDEEPDVLRVWLPDDDTPGLAMTRAFGDFCLKEYGLISLPQVFYRKLTTRDEFVVLATDGVWDVLTNLEVVRIVASARKRSMAAKLLVAHALRAWKSRFPSSRVDDIAIVCLFFKFPSMDKSLSEMSQVTPDSMSHLNSSISRYSSLSDDDFEYAQSKIREDEPEEWSVLGGATREESMLDTSQSSGSSTIRRRGRSR
ncbi:hypothetical protein Nepgr_030548 [Nepenthes gracilis]|uniref:PPM-type phosphatase domain-containing protein n=1 Tax=Nepenthes gracilis TaxID=150966 RepID=A0AAD3TFI9_NEPGR|nr:hypothetical protein Nepgr_030548 [Nepenthes gracilis]